MINENALVIYKGKPAIVKDRADGKITISLQNKEQVKVRDKDIEIIHPGPVKDFNQIEENTSESAIRETWELLLEEGNPPSLKELASLIGGEYTPASAFAVYCAIKDGLYFSGTIDAIVIRQKDEVTAAEEKRNEKLRGTEEREQFIKRLKAYSKKPQENHFLPVDSRYIQDVEALAYGKSPKSKTMKELGLSETPEDAHSLLLKTGFWTSAINPHPSRFGLPTHSAEICPEEPEQEERVDLCHLAAFAIDNSWSHDPDDAISIEKTAGGKNLLYVHIADPAASITFNCPAEKEARDRGVTLYLPEGAARMLAEEALPMYALGLSEKSLALTFKMTIDENGNVNDTEIFPSIVKVRRITYEEADAEMEKSPHSGASQDAEALCAIYNLSKLIYKRRMTQGAVDIELPDIHIFIEDGNVKIEPVHVCRSSTLVRECMITAGEGAGTWAAERGLAFPYISQEVEIPGAIDEGLAGSWQLRKCMRPRILSTKPGQHQGLGLDTYTQVTSPLRRYTDLLAHMQIRACLKGETPLNADEVSARLGFSEAAAIASVQAERASENHWLMVYLSDKKDSEWDAVVVDNKGSRIQVIIPSLALETQISLQKKLLTNEKVKLVLKTINISRGEAVFIPKN